MHVTLDQLNAMNYQLAMLQGLGRLGARPPAESKETRAKAYALEVRLRKPQMQVKRIT